MLPEVLQNIPGIIEHDFKHTRGIYFLFHKDELVYVGRSWNVYARIQQHVNECEKVFDRSFVQLVPIGTSTARLERQYIRDLQPKYNYEAKGMRFYVPISDDDFRAQAKIISRLL